MSLHEEIVDNLSGYSKAMYSTWFFYKPARILLDAGEGVSAAMENFVFGIEKVFLSHGHYAHIGGIPGVLQSRRSARGDNEKPLEVHYPRGDVLIDIQRRYVESLTYALGYELTWHPIEPGQRIELGQGRDRGYIVPFRVRHVRAVSLGFNVMEERTRLRAEYAELPEAEIADAARTVPRDQLNETYEKILLAYSGDTGPLDPDIVRDAEVLVHEATFLRPDDREARGHATVEEAIRVAVDAGVQALVLFHVSSRYPGREVRHTVRELAQRLAPHLPIALVRSGRKMWVAPHPEGRNGK
ncbi:MBL fold metallo-hydrolase [bacterium]|nr:MBL fold metallo-hydrolase [bacterium]